MTLLPPVPAGPFDRGPVTVQVPATSANLGPGFDVFGLAVDLYDEYTAHLCDDPGVTVEIIGEGRDTLPRNADHLVIAVMQRVFARLGDQPSGIRLTCHNRIPHGRGLGSSAAAIVGGVALARALSPRGAQLSDADVLTLATEVEGHPDNVAAAIFGGFTLAWFETVQAGTPGAVRHLRLEPHPQLLPIAIVPAIPVATRTARALLPATVPHADAAFNAGRAALLVHALTAEPDLLLTATEDRLHQDYRRSAFPASLELVERLRATAVPAVVSGAGPTVLALATRRTVATVHALAGPGVRVLELSAQREGVRVRTGADAIDPSQVLH